MSGGQTILTGLVLILVALFMMTFWGTFGPMITCLLGALPLILVGAGAVLLLVALTDWRAARADRASAGADESAAS